MSVNLKVDTVDEAIAVAIREAANRGGSLEDTLPALGDTSGEIETVVNGPQTLADIENIGDYLNLFGEDLIRRLNDEYVPVHHPGTDEPLEVLNNFKRPLFSSQAHVVTALIKGFRKHRNLFLIGEPGTGKTAMSIATFFSLLTEKLGGKGRVVYMVPNHLIKKTKREVGLLIDKSLFEVQFLEDYVDVIRLRDSGKFESKPTKIEVYIIARDTAKLGYIYEPAAKWVSRSYTKQKLQPDGEVLSINKTAFEGWVCPECGGQLMTEGEDGMVPMERKEFYDKHGKFKRRKSNLFCTNNVRLYTNADPEKDDYRSCGARLWQAKNRDKSSLSGAPSIRKQPGVAPRKVSPADLFKRWFKHKFDLAIGDECHELTGGSAQAHAFHVISQCAKNSIAMTGTLMNGYASNLFELIFRLFPTRMKNAGFKWGDVGRWIDLYGVREKVTKIRENDSLNSSSNGSSKKTSVKEMPAAAPQLFTDMLSDVSCFIQMSDMFEVMPTLQEGPLNVRMEGNRSFISCVTRVERRPGRTKRKLTKATRLLAPEWYLKRNLHDVEDLLREAVKQELLAGGQSVLLGSLLNTLLSYPDVPFNFKGVYHPDTNEEIVSPDYRLSDNLLYPKELELIKFVRSQLKLNRKVGVYAVYTGKMGTLQRLEMLLEERGIKTAVLESSVEGPQREEWIAQREKEGVQVLLCNPVLVSTGLDLLNFPSLYFYQTGYRLSIIRQASRRHWRIGQKNVCVTTYSAYKGTMQELALNLMAMKMNAALALEGQFSQEGLSALTEGSGGSLATELAKRFVGNNIEGVESAESIWGKMSIDASQFIPAEPMDTQLADFEEEERQNVLDVWKDLQPTVVEPSPIRTFYAESLRDSILAWASEAVPADLYSRFEQQIAYVEQNLMKGVNGLAVNQVSLLGVELVWDTTVLQSDHADFRRWAYSVTDMPQVIDRAVAKVKLELVAESKVPKTKTKKVYNVSEGQVAFNF